MAPRLPWTIWFYTLAELWKLVLLTTAVLVTVIAFAMTIKPLADGKLDPLDTFRLMMLAMVPTLQYALPFAACFGATLAYHRLAADNELTAAYAGGVSHRALLVPAIGSGVVLALVLLALTQMVIPKMLRGMAEMVTSDAARFFVSQIERGQAVQVGSTMVYADKVVRQPAPAGYNDTLLLLGLLVVKLDDTGRIDSQGAARSATVWTRPSFINRGGVDQKPATEIIIKPSDFVGTGGFSRAQSSEMFISEKVPTAFRDDPKFADAAQMRELQERPERIGGVDRRRIALAIELAEREVVERLRAGLRDAGQVDLKKPDGERWLLRAGNIRPVREDGRVNASVMQLVPARAGAGGVTLERIMPDGKVQRQTGASGLIRFGQGEESEFGAVTGAGSAMFTVILRDVVVDIVGSTNEFADLTAADLVIGKAEGRERPVPDLSLLSDPLEEYMKKSSRDLLAIAAARQKDRPADRETIKAASKDLLEEIEELGQEILSKRHERYAQSAACLIMIIVGSIMAMRLRDALPLTIYLWAFFPALLTVLTISGGQQLTHGQGSIGLLVLYSGVALLTGFAGYEFFRLSRH